MIHSTTWDDATTQPEEPPVTMERPHLHRVLRCNFTLPLVHQLEGKPTTRPESDARWRRMLDCAPFRKDLGRWALLSGPEGTLGPSSTLEPASTSDNTAPLTERSEGRVDPQSYAIRSLYLTGFVHNKRIPSILFHTSSSLTRLCIRFENTQTIDLLVILKCPRLASLSLDNCALWPFGSQTDASDESDNPNRAQGDLLQTMQADQQSPLEGALTLQNLTLTNTTVSPPSLQCLLRHCPDLRQFRFRSTRVEPQSATTYHEERLLITCLGKYCPRLDLLQLSQLHSPVTSQQPLDLREHFPRLRGVCLFDRKFSSGVQRSYLPSNSPLHVRLTSLCLEGSWKVALHPAMDDLVLHQFLCQCPTLLHLYAYDIFLDVSRLELPPRLRGASVGRWKETTEEDVLAVDIWACRDLKTLQLSFKHHDLDRSPLQHQHKVLQYLPRACPRLEQLQIDLFKIDFLAESGLSLLSSVGSGLPALETLALGTKVIRAAKPSDVAWLRKTTTSSVAVTASKSFWPWSNSKKASTCPTAFHTDGKKGGVSRHPTIPVAAADSTEGMDGWSRQGHALWPRLTQLRLFYDARDSHTLSIIRQLEALVASVRPGVDFRVVKNHEQDLQQW
ncbi:hypothetical protein BGZ70_002748 [Mortierella alpina]|uniref:F-box domain-containing protein n=1 Tax=Mortierella alpina TaxID=64518 RepID=A0A9P6ITI3_MORAP|nr:hypothetical protein BGZ70_002748 [Mortierella alpina]